MPVMATMNQTITIPRLPALFLGHGNPMHALDDNAITRTWRDAVAQLPRPRAILAISAHWVTRGLAVTAMETPETIHDFHGFPRALAEFQYPAPGDIGLARRVAQLLEPEAVGMNRDWGLDHGAWSVLAHLYPLAEIPVVQFSLDMRRGPQAHFELGQRLRPLRDEGVLILGSGNVVHNLGVMNWRQPNLAFDWAERFNARIRRSLVDDDREDLFRLDDADAHLAVPTPEHYWPLLYIAALAHEGENPRFFNDVTEYGSIGMLGFQIGTAKV
jgi:4,5-DOPA dioxygenase extradiol